MGSLKDLIEEKFEIMDVSKRLKVYCSRDEDISWQDFMPYLQDKEPSYDIRRSMRSQRKIFYLKNYYIKKLSYKHSARFRDVFRGFFWLRSKAEKQLESILSLQKIGIRTVEPVTVIVHRYSRLKKQSLLVTETCEGSTLKNFLESDNSIDLKLRKIEQGFKDIYKMHQNNISHGDANVGNIILNSNKELHWYDFDRLNRNPLYLFFKGRFYDLDYFMYSSILSLLKSGCWNSDTKTKYFQCLALTYPKSSFLKKMVVVKIRKKLTQPVMTGCPLDKFSNEKI